MKGTVMTNIELKNNNQNRTLKQWLFNPFQFIAGGSALAIGLIIMLASAYLGSLSNTHFDGVLDIHTGRTAATPLWFFITEVLIGWFCLSIVLLIAALFVSRSSFRIIDVFGTQALAKAPYLLVTLAGLTKGSVRFGKYLAAKYMQQPTTITIQPSDILFFVITVVVSLLMIIWTAVLMYRAYGVSCNIKGGKAIVSFIVSLIFAEVLSKLAIWLIAVRTS